MVVRHHGGDAELRPGDGSGRDDAGREHVHGAHHLDDDGRDGWFLPDRSGVVNNTATSRRANGGGDQSSASTCVAAPAIHIVKTADAVQVNAGDQIGFTLTVSNFGRG